jgi:hypothetical protein
MLAEYLEQAAWNVNHLVKITQLLLQQNAHFYY